MSYNKKLEFDNKQKLLIGGGLITSTLIGYKVGRKRGDSIIKRNLVSVWREDPEILYRTVLTIKKNFRKKEVKRLRVLARNS